MPTQVRNASARQFFSRQGTLSQWHPNYEFRPGQGEMAEAVESALSDRRHLIGEAGTGNAPRNSATAGKSGIGRKPPLPGRKWMPVATSAPARSAPITSPASL